jgi:hypothetical protein
VLHLRVRRFFCDAAACAKKTSAEKIPGLTFRHGRVHPALLLAHPDADRVRTLLTTWREEILTSDAATPPPTPAGPR